MKTFNIHTNSCRLLCDLYTPVALYLKIRDLYPESALLESTEYRTPESSYSFIAFCPIAKFELKDGVVNEKYPDGTKQKIQVNKYLNNKGADKDLLSSIFNDFRKSFNIINTEEPSDICSPSESNPTGINGLFGFTSYDSVSYIEPVKFNDPRKEFKGIADMNYIYYKYVVVMNMYMSEMCILENLLDGEESKLKEVMAEIENNNFDIFGFSTTGDVTSNMTDEEHIEMIEKGISHCMRGDVFQIVLGRQFQQSFLGDDFNVYRALRSINPSPYLFYFDFGSYRIFGSSPETHFRIQGKKAYIDPIAGTFKRTGNEDADKVLAKELLNDPKENAEHTMLVDLARNDLSRHASNVEVSKYKELQFYSHVIHIVSRVTGELEENDNPLQTFLDTFPAEIGRAHV